jgi:hypothetical protein
MSTIHFNTAPYEWSHGRKPRGNGTWVVAIGDRHLLWVHGTFTEAKKQAAAWIKEHPLLDNGFPIEVRVLP